MWQSAFEPDREEAGDHPKTDNSAQGHYDDPLPWNGCDAVKMEAYGDLDR